MLQLTQRPYYYEAYFDKNYLNDTHYDASIICQRDRISEESHILAWIETFPNLKNLIDTYLLKHQNNYWREARQFMVRENNFESSDSTEFVVCDQDYVMRRINSSKIKLVAAHIPSPNITNSNTVEWRLAIFELVSKNAKLGDTKSTMKRINGIINYLGDCNNLESVKCDAKHIFKQKRELGLINKNYVLSEKSDQIPMLIVVPVDYNLNLNNLQESFNDTHSIGTSENSSVELFVASSKLIGHTLYNQAYSLI